MGTRALVALALTAALLTAACSDDDGSAGTNTTTGSNSTTGSTSTTSTTSPGEPTTPSPATTAVTAPAPTSTTTAPATTTTALAPVDESTRAEIEAALAAAPAGCDPLDTRHCYLPYPSNFHTVADTATPTRRRVALPPAGAPVNATGGPIAVAEWNRNDGFSPNSTIITFVPDLDPAASNLPPWTNLGASLAPEAPVVIIDIERGERVPLWAELDASAPDPGDQALVIHPAISLPEGHTFVVALRALRGRAGEAIEPSAVFRAYRDGLETGLPAIEARRPLMEQNFAALADAGITRGEVTLAWDFTVASAESISGRLLHVRDEALATLGDSTPAFTVSEVTPAPEEGIAIRVTGTYTVPNYLTGDGGPGSRFFYSRDPASDPDAVPSVNPQAPTQQAPFSCIVSAATVDGGEPAHLVQYGHGLLGSYDEIEAGNVRAFAGEHNVVVCATKWAGFSEDDVPNAVATLTDFSNFPTMVDRMQQGVLNQIFLGRLMTGTGGLVTVPEFTRPDGTPLVDTAHLDYDGNSQGGIMGLMLAAVSPDIERAVVGVPGINYSLLLPRSVDFDTYEAVMTPAYPTRFDRTLIIAMTQMLWDRGEGGGYVQHITADPYPGTKAKPVLLHVAFGDHQVSELSAFVAARTLGATIHRPVTADGRSAETEPGWNLASTAYPSDGSGIVVWDSGAAPIPFEDLPPRTGEDPHGDPRNDVDARSQKAAFLFEDTLIDVCGGAPCTADPS